MYWHLRALLLISVFAASMQALHANPLYAWSLRIILGYEGVNWAIGAEAAAFVRAGDRVFSQPAGITEANIADGTFPVLHDPLRRSQHARAKQANAASTNSLTIDAKSEWDWLTFSGAVTTFDMNYDEPSELLYGWGYAKGGGETVVRCRSETTCGAEQVELVEVVASISEVELGFQDGAYQNEVRFTVEAEFEDLATQSINRVLIAKGSANLFGLTREALQVEGDIVDQVFGEREVKEDGSVVFRLQRPIAIRKKVRVPFPITTTGVRVKITMDTSMAYRLGK